MDARLHRLLHVRQALVGRVPVVLELIAQQQGINPAGAPDAPAWARASDPFASSLPPWHALTDESVRPSDHGGVAEPTLRAVADLVEDDARRWVSAHLEAVRSTVHAGGLFEVRRAVPYRVVREVAEQVIVERAVDPGLVRASVVLLGMGTGNTHGPCGGCRGCRVDGGP